MFASSLQYLVKHGLLGMHSTAISIIHGWMDGGGGGGGLNVIRNSKKNGKDYKLAIAAMKAKKCIMSSCESNSPFNNCSIFFPTKFLSCE